MPAYRSIPKDEKTSIATRHLGIISQRCLYWWKYLPPRTRCWYEVEDMVGDVVLRVVKVSHKFDPEKAKESTWVHHLADNMCRSILKKHQCQRLAACETVELTPLLSRRLEQEEDSYRRRNAARAVERVLELGSSALCDLIEIIFTGRIYLASDDAIEHWKYLDNDLYEELATLTEHCSATVEDFETVLHYAIKGTRCQA